MAQALDKRGSDPTHGAPWARIVIVVYRNRDVLGACLASLARQSLSDFEVIIVDNDCPEGSTIDLMLPDDRFRFLKSTKNIGFAGGANLGAYGANSEWIITLNPDATPALDWLEKFKTASERSPEYDFMSSTLVQAGDPETVDGFGDVYSVYGAAWRGGHGSSVSSLPDSDRAVFGPCGAAACYRRTVFEFVGGFDAAFFCYLEDIDLSFRLQAAGYSCLQVRNAIVSHVGGASSSGDPRFSIYQTHLNGLRVIMRNAPPLLLPLMLVSFFCAQVYIILRNRSRPETAYRVDGLRDALRSWRSAIASRPAARAQAKIGSFGIAKRLAWSPSSLRNLSTLFLREPDRPRR